MSKDSLGDRMKRYENVSKSSLIPFTPVVIRVDGKAFHTWTKGLDRPWCDSLHATMTATAEALCKTIQNAVCAYYQSDEISILVYDRIKPTTGRWFDNKLQKMVSVSASVATAAFNEARMQFDDLKDKPMALFDSRAFNVPEHEINNYMIWRQQDATRNSVSMLAQSEFSHKQLHGLSSGQMQYKMLTERDINWNDVPTIWKRGACIKLAPRDDRPFRLSYVYDPEIPIFTEDREYITQMIELKRNK